MADKKISALTSASTPLAGTEVLPVVQSSTTVKVSVANLTDGRTVAVKSLTQTGDTGAYGITATNPSGYGGVNIKSLTVPSQAWSLIANDNAGNSDLLLYGGAAAQTQFTWDSAGNLKANTGNFVQGTAAKGFNFTANTPAAGMTSQLLNWYEEGTWTPTQGAALTVVGTFSSSGTYTRIGRTVFVTGTIAATTSVASAGGGVFVGGLPFAAATTSVGGCGNAAYTFFTGVRALATSTSLYVVEGQAATTDMVFSITYQV